MKRKSILSAVVLTAALGVNAQKPVTAPAGGKAISNEDAVMELIAEDLSTMDVASQSMEAQLISISEALELDNN